MLNLIPQPYAAIAAVLLFVSAVTGAYAYGRHDGAAIERSHTQAIELASKAAGEAASRAAADAISQIKVKNVTIRQDLAREVRENTVYRDCRSGPIGLRLVNAAITGNPQPIADSELPAIEPNGR